MPDLGECVQWGGQFRVFTYRGWVIVDDQDELSEELDKIDKTKENKDKDERS